MPRLTYKSIPNSSNLATRPLRNTGNKHSCKITCCSDPSVSASSRAHAATQQFLMFGDMLQKERGCAAAINGDPSEHMSRETFAHHTEDMKNPLYRGAQREKHPRDNVKQAVAQIIHLSRKKFGKTLRDRRRISAQRATTQKDSERKRERKNTK